MGRARGEISSEVPGRVRFTLPGAPPLEAARARLVAADPVRAPRIALHRGQRAGRFLATFDPDPTLRRLLITALELAAGPPARRPRGAATAPAAPEGDFPRPAGELAGVTARFVLARLLVPRWLAPWWTALSIAPFVVRGARALASGRVDADVLDGAALATAWGTGQYGTAGSVTYLLRVGHILEESTVARARASVSLLFGAAAEPVWVVRDGTEVQVDASLLVPGDLVIVRAGSRIPVDGVVASGEGTVNQACMTGESLPVARLPGATVFAGTAVEEGQLVVRAARVGDDTRCAGIVRLLEQAERYKSGIQARSLQLADRVAPLTLALGGLVYLLTGDMIKAASVLMVDYSCAIKLAGPLAVNAGLIEAAHHGAILRGGRFLEELEAATTIVLDKTGTLTQARPEVVEVATFGVHTREYVLRNAACLEEHFPHPVARAVVRKAEQEALKHEERHSEVEYIVAHGIASTLDGDRIVVGSHHFIEEHEHVDVSAAAPVEAAWADRGLSALYVAVRGELAGLLGISDPINPGAAAFVQGLRDLGFTSPIMLTGDGKRSAKAVARHLGIERFHAEVMPDDKVRVVERLRGQGGGVVMVGDGMNDSAAISAANVGVSFDHGADLAQQAADVVLLDGRLHALLDTIRIARHMVRRIRRQSVAIVGANTVFLGMGLLGAPAPLVALLHNATTVAASVLALRPYLEPRGGPRPH